jgi:hypothetical protein
MSPGPGAAGPVLTKPLAWIAGIVIAGSLSVISASSLTPWADVPYPDGYRRWVHISSALDQGTTRFAGLHSIYANDKALEGYRTGSFPDGSVLVFDLLETRSEGSALLGGARRQVDVMRKDRKRFPDTGGWGFEEFRGDSRTDRALDEGARVACYTCHLRQKEKDLIFSTFRD